MKFLLVVILWFSFPLIANSQIGNITYHIKNIGLITIPEYLELQSGEFKKLSDKKTSEAFKKDGYVLDTNRVVFQQSGLNENYKIKSATYARVIVETFYGEKGEFALLDSTFDFTYEELKEYDKENRAFIEANFGRDGLKLIQWFGSENVLLNDKSCVRTTYVRQSKNNPPVIVSIFRFQNYDRSHILTMSYRLNDGDFWEKIFQEVLKSFKITNVRYGADKGFL